MDSARRQASDRGDTPAVSGALAFENGSNPPAKLRVAEDEPVVGQVPRWYLSFGDLVVGDLTDSHVSHARRFHER